MTTNFIIFHHRSFTTQFKRSGVKIHSRKKFLLQTDEPLSFIMKKTLSRKGKIQNGIFIYEGSISMNEEKVIEEYCQSQGI